MRSARVPFLVHVVLLACVAACSGGSAVEPVASSADALKLPSALKDADFAAPLTKASIRAVQPWIDDATFETKWTTMLTTPIAFFGAADSSYHSDFGALPDDRLPGDETLCHGDPKFDNFGWTRVSGTGVFSDNDFDDAGYCPVAADALKYLVATDLAFGDDSLDQAALEAYVDTVDKAGKAVAIDGSTEPKWSDVLSKGLSKATQGDTLVLGGEVQAATPDEVTAVRALAASDSRFPKTVIDVVRDVVTDGGSAGLRRFWLLTSDKSGARTILELKELTTPGTEFGPFTRTLDGSNRLSVLKSLWWNSTDKSDHFEVSFLGTHFICRDRLTRENPKPTKMTSDQVTNLVQAEASLLALHHRSAWGNVSKSKLQTWLQKSAATLTTRWRNAYTAAGGI